MRKLNCVVCGKPAKYDVYCEEDYKKRQTLFSTKGTVEVEVCRSCGSVFQGKDIISMDEAVSKNLEFNGKIKQFSYEVDNNKITVKARGIVGGVEKEEEHTEEFRRRKRMCLDCQKRSGGYYEAIVQIRPKYEWALNKIIDIEEIVDVKDKKEGYDILLINKSSVNKIASKLERWVTERKDTRKIYGFKEGKTLYRSVVLLRLRDKEIKG